MMFTKNGRKRFTAILLAALMLLATAAPALAETFSAIVTASSMTVYSDQKLTKKAGTLEKDTVVRITSYNDKAAKITYGGKTGYAKTGDMQAVEDVAAHAVTNTIATVYQQPLETARHSTVKKGTRLYVLAWTDEWAEVEKSGVVGYIKSEQLTAVGSDWKITVTPATPAPVIETERGTVTASSLTVYEKASTGSKKLGKLKKGEVVNVVTWDSKWAYIERDGSYGYCAVKGLTKGVVVDDEDDDDEDTGLYAPVQVTKSKLNVYQKASTSSKKLGTLKKGQVVSLMGKSGDWAHIELNGKEGYCQMSGLGIIPMPTAAPTPTPEPEADSLRGIVTDDTLTVYKSASTSARKVMELEEGDIVNVLKWTDKWACIEFGGNKGYVKLSGLERTYIKASPSSKATATPAPTKVPSLAEAEKATVIEESALVYKQPDTTSEALGALMWGDSVNLLTTADGWALIEKDGKYGYCRADAVAAVAADADDLPTGYKKADFTATVIHPEAKRYSAESTSGEGTELALGATVNVTGYDEDLEWATIAVNNELAYVPIKFLSNTKYETATTGSAMQTVLKALLSYGYFDGLPSANPDSAAAATAVKRFQEAVGMEQTGIADETVQRVLFSGNAPTSSMLADTLAKGDVSENVTRLQYRLYALGYLSKSASLDGDFGSNTAAAVTLFQKANGIEQSGAADATTLKILYTPTAVPKPSSVKAADATASTSSSPSASSGTNTVNTSGTVKLSSTYVTTMPSQLKSSTSSYSSGMSASQKLEYVIYVAQSNLGKPYVFGATGTSSFDCSGLTQYCFKKGGVSLKRTAYSQGYDSTYTKISSISSLKRGDLIFFNTISDSDLCDHVGIYLGGNCFIHASSGGHKVVVSSVASGYYNRVFSWGRRIIK